MPPKARGIEDAQLVRIGLVLDKTDRYSRGILRGITHYGHTCARWVFHCATAQSAALEGLAAWRPQGVICVAPDGALAAARLAIPKVDASWQRLDVAVPHVGVDWGAVGELAAQHLLERGMSNLAVFGVKLFPHETMTESFCAEARRHGVSVWIFDPATLGAADQLELGDRAISRWLQQLPKPVGVLLCDDDLGLWLSQLCQQCRIRIPHDIAVIGVNDDAINCQLTWPPLSGIPLPLESIGFEASSLLDRVMAGETIVEQSRLLGPRDVSVRVSSDILASEDADVLAAHRFIGANAHRNISVEDVLRNVSISRRGLERKFQAVVGRTPLKHIHHVHLLQAKRLLSSTQLKLKEVAARSGFEGPERLCSMFRSEIGMTPGAYRAQHARG